MKNEEIADKNVHKLGMKPSRAGPRDVNILGKLPDPPGRRGPPWRDGLVPECLILA